MNLTTSLWIGGGIVVLGLIVCVSIILYAKSRKSRAIKHYERIRDELTLRNEEIEEEEDIDEEDEESPSIFNVIIKLIPAFIVVIVGVNLIPVVMEQVNLATNQTSPAVDFLNATAQTTAPVTGAASTILGLTTIFFALGKLRRLNTSTE